MQYKVPLSFPSRFVRPSKKLETNKELLESFQKVEINIPLMDVIKKIPKYT